MVLSASDYPISELRAEEAEAPPPGVGEDEGEGDDGDGREGDPGGGAAVPAGGRGGAVGEDGQVVVERAEQRPCRGGRYDGRGDPESRRRFPEGAPPAGVR